MPVLSSATGGQYPGAVDLALADLPALSAAQRFSAVDTGSISDRQGGVWHEAGFVDLFWSGFVLTGTGISPASCSKRPDVAVEAEKQGNGPLAETS